MTIKEAEARTGLTRANIRYYEGEGFFTASRGENGYRNYSEEDVDTLLKVKLLRQLGFSLEEIHELQSGERSLEPALERREADLEREQRELDQTIALCRDMRSDRVSFYTLDARRYLDRLYQAEAVLEKDRDPARLFPWRRFFARDLDLSIYTALTTVVLQLTIHMNLVRTGTLLPMLLGLLFMTGGESLTLHLWGTTPGKALLGLKILREDGTHLSLEDSAQRTVPVMAFFGGSMLLAQIPVPIFVFISLGMDIWACWQVYHEKPLFWERDQLYLDGSTRERAFWDNHRNYVRVAGYLAAWAACVGLIIGGHLLAARPPHRGPDITAEEFVENYNQYMAFAYGQENLSRRLRLDGTFEDVPQEGNNVVIDITDLMGDEKFPPSSFRFSSGSGPVEQVVLTRRYESREPLGEHSGYLVSIPYEKIYASMRSLLYGRLGGRRIDALYNELVEAEGNLHSELDGIQIHSEAHFSGYSAWGDGTLLAGAGQKQSYFVEFTITLTQ